MHKDYNCAMNVTKTAVDDPGVAFYENHVCGAACNYTDIAIAMPRSTS